MKPIICLIGATATSKTSVSIDLAKYINQSGHVCEIINTDSLLFYKELNIGTAKPSVEEMSQIKHHLINISSITSPINASDFEKKAKKIINKMHDQNIIPILVGGSGFYVRALIKGMYESEAPKESILLEVSQMSQDTRRELLKEKDLQSYNTIHENDDYRTSRALEHILSHHSLFSDLKKETQEKGPYDFSRPQNENWTIHTINLQVEKNAHWDIMEKRAEIMIQDGLIQEVESILKQGFDPKLSPLGSIGYKETISYLNKNDTEINTHVELINRIYINTRRLAKSQKTFFNKVSPKLVHKPLEDSIEDLYHYIDNALERLNRP